MFSNSVKYRKSRLASNRYRKSRIEVKRVRIMVTVKNNSLPRRIIVRILTWLKEIVEY